LAENEFYRALAYKKQNEKELFDNHLKKSYDLYKAGRHMFDPYTHQMDRIFLSDIETEMEAAN
jgi:hypothetical protein